MLPNQRAKVRPRNCNGCSFNIQVSVKDIEG